MGLRLTAIATRTGDDGSTGLGDGSRTSKNSLRIAAIGDVDELNSTLGLLLTEPMPTELREALLGVQHDLFDLGGELAIPGYDNLAETQVARLDSLLEQYNAQLPRLAEFILPGDRERRRLRMSREPCRRAERALVALGEEQAVRPALRQYLNRLSDLMFVLARVLNRHAGGNDVLWQQGRNK